MYFRSIINLTRLSNKVLVSANISKNAIRCNSTLNFAPNPGLALPPHGVEETDEEFDRRFEGYFNDPEIDGWMLRKRMQDIHGLDLVPEPKIIIAALKACRRVNDYALATRYLEALKYKCGNDEKEIWPYIMQEITPTLKELGISTLEEMGYDKPELAVESPYTS